MPILLILPLIFSPFFICQVQAGESVSPEVVENLLEVLDDPQKERLHDSAYKSLVRFAQQGHSRVVAQAIHERYERPTHAVRSNGEFRRKIFTLLGDVADPSSVEFLANSITFEGQTSRAHENSNANRIPNLQAIGTSLKKIRERHPEAREEINQRYSDVINKMDSHGMTISFHPERITEAHEEVLPFLNDPEATKGFQQYYEHLISMRRDVDIPKRVIDYFLNYNQGIPESFFQMYLYPLKNRFDRYIYGVYSEENVKKSMEMLAHVCSHPNLNEVTLQLCLREFFPLLKESVDHGVPGMVNFINSNILQSEAASMRTQIVALLNMRSCQLQNLSPTLTTLIRDSLRALGADSNIPPCQRPEVEVQDQNRTIPGPILLSDPESGPPQGVRRQ